MVRRPHKGRRKPAHNTSVGVIRLTRHGYGFVNTDQGTFFIMRSRVNGAMDGDTVEIARMHKLEREQQQRRRHQGASTDGMQVLPREMLGSVQRIVERAHTTLAGILELSDSIAVVVSYDASIPYDAVLDANYSGLPAQDGDAVVVQLTTYPTRHSKMAAGYIVEVVGRPKSAGLSIDLIIARYGLQTKFSAAALEEADALLAAASTGDLASSGIASTVGGSPAQTYSSQNREGNDNNVGDCATRIRTSHSASYAATGRDDAGDIIMRRDLRERFVFTIDPADARDFDDALSLDYVDGLLRLGVHIADVSAYVSWGSALDNNARQRATSVYLPDRVLPMLPPGLSDDLCSLKPGVDRLVMTADIYLRPDGSVERREFYPSTIHSRKRLSYDEALELLNTEVTSCRSFDNTVTILREKLLTLDRFARKLFERRTGRGAIDFNSVEAKLAFNDDGTISSVNLRSKNRATSMVEEAMILANEQVAAWMLEREAPMIYRVHEEPRAASLEELIPTLAEFGYVGAGEPVGDTRLSAEQQSSTGIHNLQTSAQIQAVLRASKDRPEHYLISSLLLRAMKRAKYAEHYSGHFGLASKGYCHFTSPIRRYPDLMVHRLLKLQLALGAVVSLGNTGIRQSLETEISLLEPELAWLAKHSSTMESEAEDASHEATRLKLFEYMSSKVGERFGAVITGVNLAGLYVRENTTTADGLIAAATLGEGFELDAAHQRYHNLLNNKSWRLGQPVTVALTTADPATTQLNFVII